MLSPTYIPVRCEELTGHTQTHAVDASRQTDNSCHTGYQLPATGYRGVPKKCAISKRHKDAKQLV